MKKMLTLVLALSCFMSVALAQKAPTKQTTKSARDLAVERAKAQESKKPPVTWIDHGNGIKTSSDGKHSMQMVDQPSIVVPLPTGEKLLLEVDMGTFLKYMDSGTQYLKDNPTFRRKLEQQYKKKYTNLD